MQAQMFWQENSIHRYPFYNKEILRLLTEIAYKFTKLNGAIHPALLPNVTSSLHTCRESRSGYPKSDRHQNLSFCPDGSTGVHRLLGKLGCTLVS